MGKITGVEPNCRLCGVCVCVCCRLVYLLSDADKLEANVVMLLNWAKVSLASKRRHLSLFLTYRRYG